MSSSGQPSVRRGLLRFYKIVTTDSLRDRKLMLPKVVRKRLILMQGNNGGSDFLSNRTATIFVVNERGLSWEMELWNDEEQGRLWLRNGFHEFAVFYSLADCHLLRFKHLSDFTFSVQIHDRSASEIDYPSSLPADDRGQEPQPDDDDDDSDDDNDSDFEISTGGESQSRGMRSNGKKMMKETKQNRRNAAAAGYNPEPGRTTANSPVVAEAPSFRVNITKTYIKLGQAHIPAIFSEKYMKGSEEKVGVKVGNGEKKVWEMKVTRS